MFSWLSKFILHPREIGAVAPSSSSLANLMIRDIITDARILELGPGTGAITRHIYNRINDHSRLTLIEWHQGLAQDCRALFPKANVICADAEEILQNDLTTYNHIVSGIPFAGMPSEKRRRMFRLIRERLEPDGCFIMFQYSILTRGELKKIFGNIKTAFTPWNLPPAFVFTCQKLTTDN